MKQIVKLLGCALLASASAGVMAQEAGSIMVKAGYAYFDPNVTSGNLSEPSLPNTKINVGAAGTILLTGTYMFTDNIAVEVYGGIPLKHDIYGAGSIQGTGVLGTVKQLPPTAFLQYHFMGANEAFRPYLGLGVSYVHFQGETGSAVLTAITNPGGAPTTFQVKDTWGATPQMGFTAWFNKQWYVDASVNKSYVKTTTTLSTGQSASAKLNPMVTQFSLGYKF